MKPTHLLMLLLVPGLAGAADSRGRTAFQTACASCHYARPLRAVNGGKADKAAPAQSSEDRRTNVIALMNGKKARQMREWIAAPHKVRPDTDCDTRLLKPDDMNSLLSFLATRAQPPMPSREEVLQQEMKQDAAQMRQQQSSTRPSQGKK